MYNNTASHSGGAVNLVEDASASITNCTLSGNSAPTGSGVWLQTDCTATAENTIIAFGVESEAVYCQGTSSCALSCCDVFGNTGGDWVGCIADQADINGNFSEAPQFCGVWEDDYHIADTSPCFYAPGCGLVGALGIGCSGTRTDGTTWSGLKALYR
jgi:hypothetical protein